MIHVDVWEGGEWEEVLAPVLVPCLFDTLTNTMDRQIEIVTLWRRAPGTKSPRTLLMIGMLLHVSVHGRIVLTGALKL